MLGTEYAVISTGNIYTAIDTYDTTKPNNGALSPLGAQFQFPVGTQLSASKGTAYNSTGIGLGKPPIITYVQYKSASKPAIIAYPGLVYWVDDSFTTVTGVYSESFAGINGVAGYMMVNTTDYPGSLTGAQLAAVLDPSGGASVGNFLWIVTGGYAPAVRSITSVVAGDFLIGSATTFVPARMAANSAPTNRVVGMATTNLSGSVSDVIVGGIGPA